MDAAPSADWTLGRMTFQLSPELERYLLSSSVSWGAAGEALVKDTEALGDPAVMMLGKEQYPLFRLLCGLLGCRRALDVGTFTGLSALAMADGVGPQGRVVTVDRNAAWIDFARKYWRMAGVEPRIDARVGEAIEVLRELSRAGARFDMVFLDVDKANIREYFELSLGMLEPRGLLMVDNTVWHHWVLDPARTDADTAGMRAFNAEAARDPRVEVSMIPIADGLSLIRRRS